MLGLSSLNAIALILTLAASANLAPEIASIATASLSTKTSAARSFDARPSPGDPADAFFYPLGLTLVLGILPHHLPDIPPSYPSGSGSGGTGGNDPGGSDQGGNSGGGGSQPPVDSASEPGTLAPGMLGAGLLGLMCWRRRKQS